MDDMELDDLKSDWQKITVPQKTEAEIQQMLKDGSNPTLRGMRRQIMLESAAWLIFLIIYYSAFDGAEKPLFANILLIAASICPILTHLYGYGISRFLPYKRDVKSAMRALIAKVELFSLLSLFSRVVFMGGLLVFFSSTIELTTQKYLLFCFIGLVCLLQLYALWRINKNKVNKLADLLAQFDS